MKPTRLFDFIYYQQQNNPLAKAFSSKKNGTWVSYSTETMIDNSLKTAAGLLALGLKPGDKIAMVSYENRPEWTMIDLAALQIGVIDVPLYPTISSSDYEYILNDSGVKYAFVGSGDLYDKVKAAQENVPSLIDVFTLDKMEGRPFWEDIWNEERIEEVKSISKTIKSEELATIIYTSGTTGKPKGVMLSHDNVAFCAILAKDLFPIEPGDRALSFLPLCHIFERTASFAYMYTGAEVYFTGTKNLGGPEGDLQAVKPTFFTTVPRLLEKVYEAIYNKGLELTGAKKKLFFWALGMTENYEYDKKMKGLNSKIADRLIYSKWRAALGGNIKGILVGAAPCPNKVLRVFSAAGIPIREGYGLTETSPSVSTNEYKNNSAKIGTVGPIVKGVKVMIDESEGEYLAGEGEILVYGPNVMMGYYNKPEETAKVFKEIDGVKWFRTGDIGRLIDDPAGPFLKITDRKKELLKTSGGKYVAPAPIESKLKEDFLIEQTMVIGEKRKFVSALIVPAEEALKNWCANNNVKWTNLADVVKSPAVIAKYQSIIDEVNPNFSHIEQIKKFALLPVIWDATKEDGTVAELTPTMKLKRRVIREKYNTSIEEIYS